MKLKTKSFDVADYLDEVDVIDGFLKEAMATGDADYIRHALVQVARALGMRLDVRPLP